MSGDLKNVSSFAVVVAAVVCVLYCSKMGVICPVVTSVKYYFS